MLNGLVNSDILNSVLRKSSRYINLDIVDYMENRGNHYHNGIDFGAPGGTPLPATEKAIVADVEHNPALGGGYGKLVFLKGLESGMYIG